MLLGSLVARRLAEWFGAGRVLLLAGVGTAPPFGFSMPFVGDGLALWLTGAVALATGWLPIFCSPLRTARELGSVRVWLHERKTRVLHFQATACEHLQASL